MESDEARPILVPPAGGTVLILLGIMHKLAPRETGGAYHLFEAEFDAESGNRLHVHRGEDEVVHVPDRELRFASANSS